MRLSAAVETYLSSLKLLGGDEHQQQAKIILQRMAEWMEVPHVACKRQVVDFSDLRMQDLAEFLAWRKQQRGQKPGSVLSPFTLGKEVRYIRAFLKYSFEDPLTFELPMGGKPPTVPKVRQPEIEPRSLEVPDLDLLFKSCEHARYPILPEITPQLWWFTLLYLAYITSMRRKALFTVPRPTEQQLIQGMLYLPYTGDKGKRDRRYYLTPLACQLIREFPAKPGERLFVWVSKRGRGDYRSFYHEAERMQRKAGILGDDQSRLHVLRSTSLTHMAEGGAQLSTLQQQSGHSDVTMLQKHYLGVLTNSRKNAVESLMVPSDPPKDLKGSQGALFDREEFRLS